MSDSEETKPKGKKEITEAQRKARLENLRKGRETRKANLEKAKSEPAEKGAKYTVKYTSDSDSDTDEDSGSSSDEELELVTKSKSKSKPKRKESKRRDTPKEKSRHRSKKSSHKDNEIAELKQLVKKLAKQHRKVPKESNTNIYLPNTTHRAPPQTSTANNLYKTKLLDL